MNILTKPSNPKFKSIADILKWVERYKDGKVKKVHDCNPKIGFTLIMAPYIPKATYQTKPIIEFIENTESFIHFKTKDSEYKLQIWKELE